MEIASVICSLILGLGLSAIVVIQRRVIKDLRATLDRVRVALAREQLQHEHKKEWLEATHNHLIAIVDGVKPFSLPDPPSCQ